MLSKKKKSAQRPTSGRKPAKRADEPAEVLGPLSRSYLAAVTRYRALRLHQSDCLDCADAYFQGRKRCEVAETIYQQLADVTSAARLHLEVI